MNFDKYVITEFSDDTLAIRKRFNELFGSSEVNEITDELCSYGEFSFLFSGKKSKSVELILFKVFNKKHFDSYIQSQSKNIYDDIDEKKFVLCGYDYNPYQAQHTLTFFEKNFASFSQEDILFFAVEMHKYGATSVYNWHDYHSKLDHRLNCGFTSMSYNFIMNPISKLTCTFRDDDTGREAVSELFKKYSLIPKSLDDECYENCVVTYCNNDGKFELLNNTNHLAIFSAHELSKICNWLYSLGIRSFSPIYYRYESRLICNTVECFFQHGENWLEKLKPFIDYNEKSYIRMIKKLGTIPQDATEDSPNWLVELETKGISFSVFRDASKNSKFSNRERFYFLNKFSRFGTKEIKTKKFSIYCEFSPDEIGRELRQNAICSLIK